MLRLITALIAASTGALPTLACPVFDDHRPAKDMIAAAQCLIRDNAKDPSSVRFRNVYVGTISFVSGPQAGITVRAVCGEMIGRNGYGGMTGWQGFTYMAGDDPFYQADNCENRERGR